MANNVCLVALLLGATMGEAWAQYGCIPALVTLSLIGGVLLLGVPLRLRARAVVLVVVFAAGALGWWRMASRLSPTLPADHVARWQLPAEELLEGVVAAPPHIRQDRTVLLLDVTRAGATRPASGLVRLTFREVLAVPAGSRLRVQARLRLPRSFRTPGSFDWAGYLAHRQVYVGGSGRLPIEVLAPPPPSFGAWLDGWRRNTAAAITAATTTDAAVVLRALVLGDDDGIDAPLRDAFARAGVVHVLSVSGLHLALVAGGVTWLARWILARSERLLLWSNVDVLAGTVGTAAAVGYGVVAGMEVPTFRSALMVVGALLATLLGRRPHALRGLALSALVIVLWSPGVLFEAAFQLSFVSVAVLLAAATTSPHPGRRGDAIRQAVRSSLVASLATAPLTAHHFHQLSLIGPLANVIVIPLFGAVVLAPALLGATLSTLWPAAAHALFVGAGAIVGPATAAVVWLARWSWAAVDVPIPTATEIIGWYGVAVAWRSARGITPIVVAVALTTTLWSELGSVAFTPRPLRVTFLDVGQGDAAVVELPDGRVLLVDGGGFPGSDFDVGRAVVLPFLATRRIHQVDLVVATHPHPDHFAGLTAVFAHHPVAEWWWNGMRGGVEWDRLVATAAGARCLRPVPTDVVAGWPGLTALHPPAAWQSEPNDASIVLRLVHGASSVLLTGDAEAAAEREMLAGDRLRPSTVVKVPHHGSRTSSTAAFLARVQPRIAVMSVGADNRYGLPSEEVEARYAAAGVCVLRTDQCGAVTVVMDGATVQTTAEVAGCGCPPVRVTPPP